MQARAMPERRIARAARLVRAPAAARLVRAPAAAQPVELQVRLARAEGVQPAVPQAEAREVLRSNARLEIASN
jgi:hypothetical protein